MKTYHKKLLTKNSIKLNEYFEINVWIARFQRSSEKTHFENIHLILMLILFLLSHFLECIDCEHSLIFGKEIEEVPGDL